MALLFHVVFRRAKPPNVLPVYTELVAAFVGRVRPGERFAVYGAAQLSVYELTPTRLRIA